MCNISFLHLTACCSQLDNNYMNYMTLHKKYSISVLFSYIVELQYVDVMSVVNLC